jgi:hypothetical protein
MKNIRYNNLFAVFFSLALHAAVFALASNYQFGFRSKPIEKPKEQIVYVEVVPLLPESEPIKQQLVLRAAGLADFVAQVKFALVGSLPRCPKGSPVCFVRRLQQ